MRYAHCILLFALCLLVGCGTPNPQQIADAETPTIATTAPPAPSPSPTPAPTAPTATFIPTAAPPAPTASPTAASPTAASPTAAPPTAVPPPPTSIPPTAAAQPAATTELIVAVRGAALIAVASDGSTQPLTIDGIELRTGQIAASSDGAWLAGPTKGFNDPASSQALPEPGLVLYNTASGEQTVLPQPGTVNDVYFAPDNTALIFTVQNVERMIWQINRLDLRTREQRTLQATVDAQSLGFLPTAWTAEGILAYKQLVFGADGVPVGLFLLNPDDGSVKTLEGENYLRAVAAPDGKQVALVRGMVGMGIENPTTSLAVLDLASGSIKEIEPEQSGGMGYISWSPDSSKLLYMEPGAQWPSRTFVIAGPGITEPQRITLPIDMNQLRHLSWRDNNTLLLLIEEGSADTLYSLPIATPGADGLKQIVTLPPSPMQHTSTIVYLARQ